jgi:hypothetical protein
VSGRLRVGESACAQIVLVSVHDHCPANDRVLAAELNEAIRPLVPSIAVCVRNQVAEITDL